MMKKLNLLLLACVAIFAFSACSDDDDNTAANNLIGKWKYNEITTSVECDNKLVKEYIEYLVGKTGYAEGTVLEYFENGTAKDSDGDSFRYSAKGNKLTNYYIEDVWNEELGKYVEQEYAYTETFAISGSTLSVSGDETNNYQNEDLTYIINYVRSQNPTADIPDNVKVTKAAYTMKFVRQ